MHQMHQNHQYRQSNRRAPPPGSVERVKIFPLPWGERIQVRGNSVCRSDCNPAEGGGVEKGLPSPLVGEGPRERASIFRSRIAEGLPDNLRRAGTWPAGVL
jgi:hypothetical protein